MSTRGFLVVESMSEVISLSPLVEGKEGRDEEEENGLGRMGLWL